MPLITPPGVLAFANLFTPRAPAPGAEPRFSCILLFDEAAQKTEKYQALRQAVMDTITDEWGAKAKDPNFIKSLRLPFRDAAEKSYAGFGPGKVFIQPWTKSKPGLVDRDRNDILVPGDVWAGQLVRADVEPFAYTQTGNKGVSFWLNNLQVIKADMPRLDGRRSAKESFANEDDPDLALADDDIPF